ncbi:hypothetical protein ACE193_07790 [Bernardetia sp. OM2101]|uniref:hypothetical protein n=1 Tax=Bernardetia sp. OM2101 TaxID=3344876 RepID=UPI0035D0B211
MDNFNQKFKQLFFGIRKNIAEEIYLCATENQNSFHYAMLCAFFDDKIGTINNSKLRKTLKEEFMNSSFYILNYDAPYKGGYPIHKGIKTIFSSNDDFKGFLEELMSNYWTQKEFDFDSIELFEDREPKNIRERTLHNPLQTPASNGVVIQKHYFFNVKNVIVFYEKLIKSFFPDYSKNKSLSKKGILRYTKDIGNQMSIALYIDTNYIQTELKNMYLELPRIEIEILSNSFHTFLKQENYLIEQDEYPIYRIGFNYFLGQNPHLFRIGNSSEDKGILFKKSIFFFEQYSFFIKRYAEIIEKNLAKSIL